METNHKHTEECNQICTLRTELRDFIRKEKELSRAEGWEDAIRAVFSGGTVGLDGKFYKISNADAYRFITNTKEDIK